MMAQADKKVLHTLIDESAALFPDKVAIEYGKENLSYGELRRHSNTLGAYLRETGVAFGAVGGIFLESSFLSIVAQLGISKAGGIFMPLEIDYPQARLRHLLIQASPVYVITRAAYRTKLQAMIADTGLSVRVVLIDDFSPVEKDHAPMTAGRQNGHSHRNVTGDDSNYLIYTSGSTGQPKIIEGCHKSLSHFVHWQVSEFRIDGSVRVSQLAPSSFDVSFRDIYTPLLAGGTVVIPDGDARSDPRMLIRWIADRRISMIHTVPSLFKAWIQEIGNDGTLAPKLGSLRYIFLAGEPLHSKTVDLWRQYMGHGVRLVNLYGPSETTLAKMFYRIPDELAPENHIIPLGLPISNTSVAILRDGALCAPGAIGEICIKTPFQSKGYYRQPDLTRDKFVQNPLHNKYDDILYMTGDLGKYGPGEVVEFVGRADSQVKIRGNRVELLEIEKVVQAIPGVNQVVVLALHNLSEELVLTAYYTADGDVNIKKHLDDVLPTYMIPSFVVKLDGFPLLLNGKIDKKSLPRPEALLFENVAIDLPSNDLEKKIAGLWCEVLGVSQAGVNLSFFDMGGHSLSATRIISRLYQETGTSISLRDFFKTPTIRGVCGLLQTHAQQRERSIPVAPSQQYYPLSHTQKWLWVLHEVHQNMSAYNMPLAFMLDGPLHVEALKKALRVLLERYEIFRTRVVRVSGEPFQEIVAGMPLNIEVTDLSQRPDGEKAFAMLAEEEAVTPFDLAAVPLFRIRLFRVSDTRHGILLTMHHIISDGWSIELIVREVSLLYQAFTKGEPDPLPVLGIQYKDFAVWQNQLLNAPEAKNLRNYWKEKLKGQQPLVLPVDNERTDNVSFSGDHYHLDVDNDKVVALEAYCRHHNVTLFMAMVALVKLTLYRLNAGEDISVGTPVSGRNHPDLEHQVGFFLNSVIIRSHVEEQDTIAAFLQQVKQTTLEAFDHQNYPYPLLVSDLFRELVPGRNPLYDVLVVMDTNGAIMGNAALSDHLAVIPVSAPNPTSKLDLSFLIKAGNGLRITIEYKTALFYPSTIAGMAKVMDELIGLLLREDQLQLKDLRDKVRPDVLKQERVLFVSEVKGTIQEDF